MSNDDFDLDALAAQSDDLLSGNLDDIVALLEAPQPQNANRPPVQPLVQPATPVNYNHYQKFQTPQVKQEIPRKSPQANIVNNLFTTPMAFNLGQMQQFLPQLQQMQLQFSNQQQTPMAAANSAAYRALQAYQQQTTSMQQQQRNAQVTAPMMLQQHLQQQSRQQMSNNSIPSAKNLIDATAKINLKVRSLGINTSS